MKIRCLIHENDEVIEKLKKAGFEISDEADLLLIDQSNIVDHFIGKKDNDHYVVLIEDILFFESIDRYIYLYTKNNKYQIKERLFELEIILDTQKYIRISNSAIINRRSIKKITPQIGSKFVLTMINDSKLVVTRNYYYKFKEFFKI